MSSLFAFITAHTYWLITASVLSLIISLLLIPVFITRIPVDYFSHPQRHPLSTKATHPLLRLLISGLKNCLGILFIITGLLMLFLPGQGLLTLLAGLIIMNYPGKFTLESWLIQRPHVLPSINWLRTKYKKPPLQEPPSE